MLSVQDVVVKEVEFFKERILLRLPYMNTFFVSLICDMRFEICASTDDFIDSLLSSLEISLLLSFLIVKSSQGWYYIRSSKGTI